MPGYEPRIYRCPPAWKRWTALAGGAATAWMAYLALTSDRPFDVGLAAVLAVTAAAVTGAVSWRLFSWSTSVSASGLTIRRGRSAVLIPWARIATLRVEEVSVALKKRSGNAVRNDQAVCCEVDGTWHVLPYLTSVSGRVVGAEVTELRRLWQRERGRRWVAPPTPARRPAELERRGRVLLLVAAGELAAVCVGVLLLDLGGRAAPLSPADGVGMLVFLTLVLVVPTVVVTLVRRRATVSRVISRPQGKRR
ncbi:hypothetical protein QRX60_49530 [Amycolatopsis mongoliensis]|uniref:PH domain-containing protein n=1 Tax=Amycolatopsis mongoliensis TaxID=715475 RepID=A0A9Y2JRC5_9PSEU|nr:hypothetical protein [Amycolatopsis sp. 4-36]WIY01962.1 hypothetical protein QRX60_49530 [Amycolatopsis sp. 4-36]